MPSCRNNPVRANRYIAHPAPARPALSWTGVVLLCAVGVLTAVGCGGGGARDRQLPYTPDPVAEARAIVTAYANGQAVGSETVGFEDLLGRVESADAAKAAKLRPFLQEVMKQGSADAAKAKKLLAEL